MVLLLRTVRDGWSPRRSLVLSLSLSLSLLALGCTDRDERTPSEGSAGYGGHEEKADAGANGGSPDPAGDAGASAGNGGSPDPAGEAGAGAGGSPQDEGEAGAGGVGGRDDSTSQGGSGGDDSGGEGGSPSDPPPTEASGLPCEVETILRKRCQSCHSSHPLPGAQVSLTTYANLTARSAVDPSVTVAARVLKRIKDVEFPMPPAPVSPSTSAEIATIEAWIEDGKPPGSCDPGGEPSSDPYDAPPVCSSDTYWTGGTSGSPWMMPGRACIACHKTTNGRGPRFTIAGTLFPTAHEPDKCYGVPAAAFAKVIITDANGVELPPIPVNAGGNFNVIWSSLAVPYRAKVVVGDKERVMLTPQTSGDCNGCHTQFGAEGARGRIIAP